MKRLLNTLYVTTQGAYLSKEGDVVHVRVDNETKLRIPIITLGSIVCFGNVMCSPYLMGMCGKEGVAMAFLSEYGRFLCRVEGPTSGNVLLRRRQFRMADNLSERAKISRGVISAKISNCRNVLMRAVRDNPDPEYTEEIKNTCDHLARILRGLEKTFDVDTIRGIEGDAARIYFNVFDHLIISQKEEFRFNGRSRRPPMDRINALLSFLYTLVVHDIESALEGVGLDPAVGFLHTDRPGRPGLALDLMEEFRPFLADRLALSLINRKQIKAKGFKKSESGAVEMDDDTRKELLLGYQKRKQQEITHPYLNEKVPVGLLPHVQAMLLARYIRGDLDGYPPFYKR